MSLKGQLIQIFGDNQFMSKHTFHIQNPSKYVFQLYILQLLISLMSMRYVSIQQTIMIFNIQDYWLCMYLHFGLIWLAVIPTVL